MGTWTRNFLLPKAEAKAVRDRLVNWLERKGFDESQRSLLFTEKNEDERALCLISNANWTVVLYREAFEEGDRLLSELLGWPVLLEVVIADSDVWAYDLIEDGNLTASFNSNPHYFGGDEQKLPLNGDPERLCRALGLEGLEARIGRLQKKRSLFSDFPCQAFCQLIGASAGALHFNDFDFRNSGSPGPKELAGWRVETLFFERRRPFGEEPPGPILHSLVVRQFETRERGPVVAPEFVKSMERQAQLISLLFKPLAWLAFCLGPMIHWWLRREMSGPTRKRTGDPLLDALRQLPASNVSAKEGWLVNPGYGLRIRASARPPTGAESLFGMPGEVFQFTVDGLSLSTLVIRLNRLRSHFLLQKGMTLVSDESFFVNAHPARALAFKVEKEGKPSFGRHWFVEFEGFVVWISSSDNTEPSPESSAKIRQTIETLEQIPSP